MKILIIYLELFLNYLVTAKDIKLFEGRTPTIKVNKNKQIFFISVKNYSDEDLARFIQLYLPDFLHYLRMWLPEKLEELRKLEMKITQLNRQIKANHSILIMLMKSIYSCTDVHYQSKLNADIQKTSEKQDKLVLELHEMKKKYRYINNQIRAINSILSGECVLQKLTNNHNRKYPCIYAQFFLLPKEEKTK